MVVPEPDDLGVEETYIFGPAYASFSVKPYFYPNASIYYVPEDTPEWFWEDGILYHTSYPPKDGWVWG